MIDLTPLEVRKKKGDFRKAMRGYEPQAVDDFIDLVADRLEQLVRENASLSERVRSTEIQVTDYRERERALTEALVTAQEMREQMRRQMEREVEIKMREAEADVEEMRSTAAQMREREEENIRRLRARQTQFVQSYRAFLERELAEIGVMAQTLNLSTPDDQLPPPPRKRARKAEPAPAPAATPQPPRAPSDDDSFSVAPLAAAAAAIPVIETTVTEVAIVDVEEPPAAAMFDEDPIEPVRVAEPEPEAEAEPEPVSDDGLIDLDAIFPPDAGETERLSTLSLDAFAEMGEAEEAEVQAGPEPEIVPPQTPVAAHSVSQLDLSDIPFDDQEIPELELVDEVEDDDPNDEDTDGWVSTLLEGKGD